MKLATHFYILTLVVFLFLSMIFTSILLVAGKLDKVSVHVASIDNQLTQAEICEN